MKLYLYIMLLGWLLPSLAFAQSYAIDWYKIAGGGVTSTGATLTSATVAPLWRNRLSNLPSGNHTCALQFGSKL